MRYRTFGRIGWKVSEIGFGGWQLGGDFGQVDDKNSIRTLLHAWNKGINFVDTAQMYGKGRSEEVIGQALKEWSGDHIYVATKVQPTSWPSPKEDDPDVTGLYPSDYLRKQCEASLRRLKVESIDLFQLHGWFPACIHNTEWYETLLDLIQEGKIREIGISIRDYRPQEGVAVASTGMVGSEQVVFNLFEQRPAETLFPVCLENRVAVIARVPFDEGSLIGNWTADTYSTWGSNDVRVQYFKGQRFAKTLSKVEELKETIREVASNRYSTLAEAALRYCLSESAVSVVIPGMKSPEEVDMNVSISDGEGLSESLLRELNKFRWPRNYHNSEED